MICKLCNSSVDLGKSHIIPESFFLNAGSKDETSFIASNKKDDYPKRRPIGEYDSNILCKNCEVRFGQWDNYAKKILIDEFSKSKELREGNTVIGHSIDNFDYEKLKLFFISVLWRSGVSQRDFFEKVDLGPHEQLLKNMLFTNNPGNKDEYSIQVFSFTGISHGIPIIMPIRIRSIYGYQYYRIYLGEIFYDIKVDSRKTPKQYSLGEVTKGEPLLVPTKNIKEMSEYKIIKLIANSPNNANAI